MQLVAFLFLVVRCLATSSFLLLLLRHLLLEAMHLFLVAFLFLVARMLLVVMPFVTSSDALAPFVAMSLGRFGVNLCSLVPS